MSLTEKFHFDYLYWNIVGKTGIKPVIYGSR